MNFSDDAPLFPTENKDDQKRLNEMISDEYAPYVQTQENPFPWYTWMPLHYNLAALTLFLICTSILHFDIENCSVFFIMCAIFMAAISFLKLRKLYPKIFEFYFTSTSKNAYTRRVKKSESSSAYQFWSMVLFCSMESGLIIYTAEKLYSRTLYSVTLFLRHLILN